ncbi:MAG TPA: choice-of-anchor C family protein [Burkholderiaceae bacterium]|nr:choice-of-anchor C family protein [Burkholderiaceae bacterium]
MRKFLLACLAAAACTGAHAELVVNGSFENGTAPGSFTTLGTGSTAIDGWRIGKGSIDYIGGYWVAADGSRSIDLAGNDNPTSLYQDLATAAGSTYTVSFFMSGNKDGEPLPVKPLTVSVYDATLGGLPLIESNAFSFDTTGITNQNMRWTQYGFEFVAASALTRLSFEFDADPAGPGGTCCFGPALDQVSVVPAPGTLLLLGAGLATIGAAGGRRRAKA